MEHITGRQGIHWAAFGGHVSMIAKLRDIGCDLSVPASDGSTALHLAADNGNLDAMQWLVRHGADIHKKNGKGQTPEELAKLARHKPIANYLQLKGNEVCGVVEYNERE